MGGETVEQGSRRKRRREFKEILMKLPGKVVNGPGHRGLNHGDVLDSRSHKGFVTVPKTRSLPQRR